MNGYGYIERNYRELLDEVGGYEERYKRKITVVAVTKSGSDEELIALARAGVTDIGENRPGELKRRGELLAEHGYRPRLHEIGNLQRNKVKLVAGMAHLIHSVGTLTLGEEISKRARELGITVPVLIEVNSAREQAKGGVMPEEAEALYLAVRELPSVEVRGIMTMGPAVSDAELLRPYFRLTKQIYDGINERYGFTGEGILSMGMSDSYAVAIEEGSTLIRVGRKLFDKNEGRK